MLSSYAKIEWVTITILSMMLSGVLVFLGQGYWALLVLTLAAALLSFFRDPDRVMPTQRHVMVAPADGKVTSVHRIDHFEPFGEPVVCVRIFLSVFDVHINRCPTHCVVKSIEHRRGRHRNALKADSAEDNESNLIVLAHPVRGEPIAAVRQVSGMIARTIVCGVREGQILQRGERIGMIKLGSTTELYISEKLSPQVQVQTGQKVYGAVTVLANVMALGRNETADGSESSTN